MAFKTVLSKKVAAIALAGTIGLGAVGGATYAAAPGLVDKIVNNFILWTNSNLDSYKQEKMQIIPAKVKQAFSSAQSTFDNYYSTKVNEARKKIDEDVDAYVKEKGTVTEEERATAEEKISQHVDKKRQAVTDELKVFIDNEFKK